MWVNGAVPEVLEMSCPIVLDWSMNDLTYKDQTKWPPSNAALSDLVAFKIIAGEVSLRDRSRKWPAVFQSSGHDRARRQMFEIYASLLRCSLIDRKLCCNCNRVSLVPLNSPQ